MCVCVEPSWRPAWLPLFHLPVRGGIRAGAVARWGRDPPAQRQAGRGLWLSVARGGLRGGACAHL